MATRAERAEQAIIWKQRLHLQATRFGNEIIVPVLVDCMDYSGEPYRKKISPMAIVKNYGANCEKIFRILFTLYQIGGRSKKGKNYVTLWYVHHDNLKKYCEIINELTGIEYSAKMILDKLRAAKCSETRRIKMNAEPEVIGGQALQDYKEMVTILRQFEREEQERHDGTYWS